MALGRVDEAVLTQLIVDLGAGNARELCQRYLENATRDVGAVSEALAAGDGDRAARVAHRLKSASGFVGATGLVALCVRVEAGDASRSLGEDLAGELERVTAELHLSVRRLAG